MAKIGGKMVFTLVVIHEEVDEDVGEFGIACVDQYRAITRTVVPGNDEIAARVAITWKIWRKRTEGDKEIWFVYDEGEYTGMSRIPLATGYLGRKFAPMVAEPPLNALAELNIGHYRVSADRRWLMSIVHAPTFTLEGWTNPPPTSGMLPGQANMGAAPEMKLGPAAVLRLPVGCTAKWTQAEPDGLDSSKEEKDDLMAQMASMSIAFLSQERKSQETARAHEINATSQNATLATAARGLKDLFDEGMEIHCGYLGIPAESAPTLTINTTYDDEKLDAPTITALNGLAKDANLTRQTLLLILQRGKIVPEDVDVEEEAATLDEKERTNNDAMAKAAQRAHALIASASAPPGDAPPKAA
ncbi:MAG: DUF4055 domain-containing protein [bacterium]